MRTILTPPSVVPEHDFTVYIVLDNFGRSGQAYRETDVNDCDRRTVIRDLIDGQFRGPLNVIAFNTAEGWSSDVSEDIAREVVAKAFDEGETLPRHVQHFCERHLNRDLPRQVIAA